MSLENLCFKIEPSQKISTKIEIPTSKSFANRALILAAVISDSITINNVPESTDVLNLISSLRLIGLKITIKNSSVTVHNSFPLCEVLTDKVISLETGDGGTTNRFLIPLLALGQNTYEIIPSHKMKDRPMQELDTVLKTMAVDVIRNEKIWFAIKGPVRISEHVIDVDCSESTQFATGLALALSQFYVDINPVNLTTSTPYWEMTLDLIERTRVERVLDVPVDFSSLSYPLAFAALNGEVIISNCFGIDRFQADSIFIKILENVGAKLKFVREGLLVRNSNLTPFDFDAKNCPDLIPTLCFLASYIQGKSVIRSVEVLKHKESDRLAEMINIMEAFEVNFTYHEENDLIEIQGSHAKTGFTEYHPPVDHRMVMVAYLYMRQNNGGSLYNSQCVNKSFPTFFEVMGIS